MHARTPDDHQHHGARRRATGGLDAIRRRVRSFAFRTTLGPATGLDQPAEHTPHETRR
ncbi:MAG: hypothetical protein U0869_06550 [Chloroflexota bacterium]